MSGLTTKRAFAIGVAIEQRRFRIYHVDHQILGDIIQAQKSMEFMLFDREAAGLPLVYSVLCVEVNQDRRTLAVTIASPDFDRVEECDMIPESGNDFQHIIGFRRRSVFETHNDRQSNAVVSFFLKAMIELWNQGEGFTGKRPLGNSGWKEDLIADACEDWKVSGKDAEKRIGEVLLGMIKQHEDYKPRSED